ncbi:glycerophosphodiester phosphodiesterase [Heyndrickxia acidicola]|uniref:Glycerophosphodiester phosphodiesterase n=1 Tax=Heyndrickxia acidicola TaxID=209389 RepID=A0ABU6ML18_9BACI|nr:glycerophosphodiester phosphodiesterase [Heyndrickxia acidicola]MED1205220.1 glycerophosphodiester phosphodiesterase [Heyndrickxia acidicola]
MTLIFAHRGSSGTFPENTMDAFFAAEKSRADGIELDVQLTKDGEVVVIHDETVDRTTNGKGFVKDYSFSELKKLNAHSLFTSIEHTEIPSLREVFEWMSGNRLLCNVELKTGIIAYPMLEEKVIQLIHEYGFQDRIIISSFNHYSIIHSYRLDPEIEIAPLYSNGLYMPWVYAKSLHAKGIHPHIRITPDSIIIAAMKEGIAVRPYTINKEEMMKRLFSVGCSALITDFPEKAYELRIRI